MGSKSLIYYRTIWTHITAFADLFNDFKLHIYDKDEKSPTYGEIIGYKNVNVYLAPKEKVISALLNANSKTEKGEVDNILPKISIAWQGIQLVPERLRGQKQKRHLFVEFIDTSSGQQRIKHWDYQTVPYSLEFEVVIWTKYMDDAVQLLENILPFFAPEMHVSIKERGIGTERKCMVRLNSITPNLVSELNEPDKRVVQYTLGFSLECNLYKPIYFDKEIHVTRIYVSDMSKSSSNIAHGDVLTMGVSGAMMYGIDPTIISRIAEIDQDTASTATYSGPNNFIEINTWKPDAVKKTPVDFPGDNQFNVQEPTFDDIHDPTAKYEHPEGRNLSYNYYNKLNDPLPRDETAPVEYQEWLDNKGPPPLTISEDIL
jgi:hypothetical protein